MSCLNAETLFAGFFLPRFKKHVVVVLIYITHVLGLLFVAFRNRSGPCAGPAVCYEMCMQLSNIVRYEFDKAMSVMRQERRLITADR